MRRRYTEGFPIFLLGVLSGVILFVCLYVVIHKGSASLSIGTISSGDFSTLLAGFGGAAFGGLISWALARGAAAELEKAAEQEKIAKEKALALSLVLKVQQITNGLYSQREYIWAALNLQNEQKRLGEPVWQFVQPQITGAVETPVFDATEYIPLVQAKRADLINDCQLLALRYNVLEHSMREYSARREVVQRMLRPFSKRGAGGQIETMLPAFKKDQFEILVVEIESLITSLRKTLIEDYASATQLLAQMTSVLNDYFEGGFMTVKLGE